MKTRIKLLTALLLIIFAFFAGNDLALAQLEVDDSYTAQELIEDILLGGGVDVSNVTLSSGNSNTFYGKSFASFDGSDADIDLEEGILLTSGSSTIAPGPNDYFNATLNMLENGDSDLDQLIPGYYTFDATVIEFDFVPIFEKISFDYVFASEEYREFACSDFNDVFGFFVSGPGISGSFSDDAKNIALVPNSNSYVGINTVNDDCHPDDNDDFTPGWLCSWGCSPSNSMYFNSNIGGEKIEYDGFTDVFTAEIDGLEPCETYHIKLAIADAGDRYYDSGVFIEAGSFESVGEYGGTEVVVCSGESKQIGPDEVSGLSYTWTDPDGHLSDTDVANPYVEIENTGDDPKEYDFPLQIEDCVSTTFTVTVYPEPDPDIEGEEDVCEEETDVIYSVESSESSSYSWEIVGDGSITSSETSNTVSVDFDETYSYDGSATLTCTETDEHGCEASSTFEVTVHGNPYPQVSGSDACEGETRTYSIIDPDDNSEYEWEVSGGTPSSSTGTSIDITWDDPLETYIGNYTITVTETNEYGCEGSSSRGVSVWKQPTAVIDGETDVCAGGSETYSSNDFMEDGWTVIYYEWTVVSGDATINGADNMQNVDLDFGGSSGTVILRLHKWIYYTYFDNWEDCGDTQDIEITVTEIDATVYCDEGDCDVCAGEDGTYYFTDEVAEGTYSWSVSGGTLALDNGSSIYVDWGDAGTGTVSCTVTDANGCTGSGDLDVTINELPEPNVSGEEDVCVDEANETYSTPDNAGSTYSWSVSSGASIVGDNTGSSITVDFLSPISVTVSVTETNADGCSATDYMVVEVHENPEPEISGETSVCAGATETYSVPFDETSEWLWSVSGGSIIGDNDNNEIEVEWGAAGEGSVFLTETSMYGCEGTDEITVTINPLPEPEIVGEADVCDEDRGEVYETMYNDGSTYSWTSSGNVTITNGENTYKVTVNFGDVNDGSTATLTVEETDANGCTNTDDYVITIHDYPEPLIEGTNSLCENTNGVSYSTTDNSSAGNTYDWSVTGGTIASGQGTAAITVDWGGAGSGRVSVTETSQYGCATTDNYNVSIHPNPEPEISGDYELCENSTGYVYSTPFDDGNDFDWEVTGGTIVSGNGTNSITVDWGSAGSGLVKVTETSIHGCVGEDEMTVTIRPNPTPEISGPEETCQNYEEETYSTEDESASGNSYSWTVTGGRIIRGQGTASIVVIWETTGTLSVEVTETTMYGCVETDMMYVVVLENPFPEIQGDDIVCEGEEGINYSVAEDNSYREYTYEWTVVGGTIVGANDGPSITVNWGSDGEGSVSVVETSQYGCSGDDELQIQIDPTPAPAITGDTDPCENDEEAVFYTKSVRGNSYSWTVTGGTINSGQGTNSIRVNWGSAGTGTVTVMETSPEGCVGTDEKTINIHELPEPSITGLDEVCEREAGVTYSTTNDPDNEYRWRVIGGSIISGQNTSSIVVDWRGAGDGSVYVIETSPFGCEGEDELPVSIYPYPKPSIDGERVVCSMDESAEYYTTNNSSEGNTYRWEVTGGTIRSGQNTARIRVGWAGPGTGIVKVIETSVHGCATEDEYNVTINPLPDADIDGPISVCEENYVTYTTTADRGTTSKWTVQGGTIIGPDNSNMIKVLWGLSGSGSVSLTQIITATGCENTNSRMVTIHPLPEPLIQGTKEVCGGSEHTYSANTPPDVINKWTVYLGEIIGPDDGNSIVVEWDQLGLGYVSLVQTTGAGCTDSTKREVRINRLPSADIDGERDVCASTVSVYTTSSSSGADIEWSVSGGTILGPNDETTLVVQWNNPGEGVVHLKKESAEGCESEKDRKVTIHPKPDATIAGARTACVGGEESYSAIVETGSGMTNYWMVEGGEIMTDPSRASIDVKWGEEGSGSVLVIQTNKWGCSDTTEIQVTIVPGPTPDITGVISVCVNSTHDYQTSAVSGVSNEWDISGPAQIVGPNTGNMISVQFNEPGTVTIMLEQTNNSSGCKGYAEIEVIVNPLPDVSLDLTDKCENDPAFEMNGAPAGGTYSGPGVTGSTFDPAAAGTGTHEVTYTYTDENGCENSVTATITVHPQPDKPTITQDGAVLTSSADEGNQWYKDGEEIPGATDKTYTMTESGTYTVRVRNQWGCESVSDELVFDISLVNDLYLTRGIYVYPNPTEGMLHIEFVVDQPSTVSVSMHNLLGGKIYADRAEGHSGTFRRKIDLKRQTNGVYMLYIRIDNNVYNQKVIISK